MSSSDSLHVRCRVNDWKTKNLVEGWVQLLVLIFAFQMPCFFVLLNICMSLQGNLLVKNICVLSLWKPEYTAFCEGGGENAFCFLRSRLVGLHNFAFKRSKHKYAVSFWNSVEKYSQNQEISWLKNGLEKKQTHPPVNFGPYWCVFLWLTESFTWLCLCIAWLMKDDGFIKELLKLLYRHWWKEYSFLRCLSDQRGKNNAIIEAVIICIII